jgi:hypothetical protein
MGKAPFMPKEAKKLQSDTYENPLRMPVAIGMAGPESAWLV